MASVLPLRAVQAFEAVGRLGSPLAQPHFLAWNGTALDRPNCADLHAWLIHEARRFDWQPCG